MNDKIIQNSPRKIAAIDLGSNSFHLVVARIFEQELQIVSRYKQQVRLGAGLNKKGKLSKESIERGVECLAMFAERIEGFGAENVKAAATFTLREAQNKKDFLKRAKDVFPYPIEIISGDEEARLIYHGVSNTIPGTEQKLVVDIGGGSTELIIGKQFETLLTCSKRMGCVNYNARFFADGKISQTQFEMAQLATEVKLESIVKAYQKQGWKKAFGSSGTIKTIRDLIIAKGFKDGLITRKRLNTLIEEIVAVSHYSELKLTGLSAERQPIIAAGVAILSGVFNALNIEKMHYSTAALREGLLYEMEEKFHHIDIRVRTAKSLAERYAIDSYHATNVNQSALNFYRQCQIKDKNSELKDLLHWAALLHEVGLSISHSGFHKHSAYILQHTNMPGFNQEQQQALAILARFHRKSLKLQEIPELTLYKPKQLYPLIRALRLACIINVRRTDNAMPKIILTANEDCWILHFPENLLKNNRLLAESLKIEQQIWQSANWRLEIKK